MSALERVLGAHGVTRAGTDVVLVACSGGLDSVCVAHAAVSLLGGRRVVLGHVDHRVRIGSAEDADAVRSIGKRLGVEVFVERLPPGADDEARLRRERYEALERQRLGAGARWIITAHTRDDQAETVLMGLLTSARPEGLRGIPEMNGVVLRPILSVPRSVLAVYAEKHRLQARDDPSNREPRYLRNRVRKELLPLLERRYRPQLRRRLASLAARMSEWLSEGSARRDVAGPEKDGSSRSWPETRSEVRVHPLSPWLDGCMWLKMERRPWTGGEPPAGVDSAAFDAALVGEPRIRLIRPGDKIQPFGMRGRRKLRDLLREARVPENDRRVIPVVVDPADEVLWVPRIQRSAAAPVSGTTREVWWFSIGLDLELPAQESQATLYVAGNGKT